VRQIESSRNVHRQRRATLRDTLQLHNNPPYYECYSYLRFKSYELEYTFQKKNCSEAYVEAI